MAEKKEARVVVSGRASEAVYRWVFRISASGQLDYEGEAGADFLAGVEPLVVLEASPFFSGGWYEFLDSAMARGYEVWFYGDEMSRNADVIAFVTHIGPVLGAVAARDGLLVAELLHRRREIFSKFASLTQHLIEPVAVSALFAWVWGRFDDEALYVLERLVSQHELLPDSSWGATELCYAAALGQLKPVQVSASDLSSGGRADFCAVQLNAAQLMERYFYSHPETDLTIGLVGTGFHAWTRESLDSVSAMLKKQEIEDFIKGESKARDARQRIFGNIRATVQAEPYNPHDHNAIAVYLEDLQAVVAGSSGKTRCGYLRKTGAAIIRSARPNKLSFSARLKRIGNYQDGKSGVVVQIVV